MQIRRARATDIERLRQIYLESRRSAFPWLPRSRFEPDDFERDTRDELVLVVEVEDRIVGFSSSYVSAKFIHHVFLDPAETGTGIGTALLEATVRRIGKPARLKCQTRNRRALAFYRARGWREVGKGVSADGRYRELELGGPG